MTTHTESKINLAHKLINIGYRLQIGRNTSAFEFVKGKTKILIFAKN